MNAYKICTKGGVCTALLYDPTFSTSAWKNEALTSTTNESHQCICYNMAVNLSSATGYLASSDSTTVKIWGNFATSMIKNGTFRVRTNRNLDWPNGYDNGYPIGEPARSGMPNLLSNLKLTNTNNLVVVIMSALPKSTMSVTNAEFNSDGTIKLPNGKAGYATWINIKLPLTCGGLAIRASSVSIMYDLDTVCDSNTPLKVCTWFAENAYGTRSKVDLNSARFTGNCIYNN